MQNNKLQDIIKYCEAHKINITSQQQLILEVIILNQEPITANEILLKLKELNPKANRMTIHRGLEYLVKSNLVHKVAFNLTYKLCNHLSTHSCQILICQNCKQQIELHSEQINNALTENSKKYGFIISNPIEITGFCNKCNQLLNDSKRGITMTQFTVNTKFDAGSIIVNNLEKADNLHFKIRNDTNSHFAQWFYFQLNNVKHQELKLHIDELDKTAYPDGWKDYNVCASYNNKYWFRVSSEFKDNTLSWSITPEANSIYFAYFEPYSYAQHLELISFANSTANTQHLVLGQTAEGRNIDLLVVGEESAKHKIWVIARQHPGETMAEWFMEGLIHRLLDEQDAISNTLLQDGVFYLVPNMNPDGAYNGNLRTNTNGANLNREWLTPSIEKSPEVYYVRQKMLETGVDVFFDIHGDEALPYIFTAGCEDNPSFSAKQKKLSELFEQTFVNINPDYQTKYGYEKGHFSAETPTVGTSWVGNQFDCLAFTLEVPFKHNANLPDLTHGWNGYRSYLLGQSLLTGINVVLKSSNN